MTDNIDYVVDNGDDGIEILESGHIDKDNISKMKFSFSKGVDITESLNKKKSTSRQQVSVTKNGRTGYSALTCTYPNNKDTSSKILLTGCILQYREGVDRDNSEYGRSYATIGVPTIYINKIRSDAKANSSLNLSVKENVKSQEGYYWFNCTLDNLADMDTWIIYKDNDNEAVGARGNVHTILSGLKANLLISGTFTCSASMSTDTMDERMDLVNGTYTITMKPTEMFIHRKSDIAGPQLEDTIRRRKEGASKGEKFMASDELAQFAMRHLTI